MDALALIHELEKEWELETGFFGKLRQGNFDPEAYNQVVHLLETIDFKDEQVIDRRLVSLTWFIPVFMNWQRERLSDQFLDSETLIALDQATDQLTSLLMTILGVP